MWLFTLLVGCETLPTSPSLSDPAEAKVVPVVRSTFFVPAPDMRDCAWPMCGGYLMDPPNRGLLRCPDGSRSSVCYVVEIDRSQLALDASEEAAYDLALGEGRLLLEGDMVLDNYAGWTLARFEATAAWEGQTGHAAAGGWVLLEENGLQCYAEPCTHLDEGVLNQPAATMIADLDFTPSGASEAQIAAAWDATLSTGLIVAGFPYIVSGAGGDAPARRVTELFLPLGG